MGPVSTGRVALAAAGRAGAVRDCAAAGVPPCCCCEWPCKYTAALTADGGSEECACPVECSRPGVRCSGKLEPNWVNHCEGQLGAGGASGTGGGCPGCGGGRTGTWGPGANGGGGGLPASPPGWGILGGGVTGPWRPLSDVEVWPPDDHDVWIPGNRVHHALEGLVAAAIHCLELSGHPWKTCLLGAGVQPILLLQYSKVDISRLQATL